MFKEATIRLTPAAQALLARFQRYPERIREALRGTMDYQNQLTIAHISRRYLSYQREGPPMPDGLRVQTGKLRQSLRARPASFSGQILVSSIGSNLKYAAIHEFGGRTGAHRIVARQAKALKIIMGGKVYFRKAVNHPGSQMPARAYIRRGIADRIPEYRAALSQAVLKAA